MLIVNGIFIKIKCRLCGGYLCIASVGYIVVLLNFLVTQYLALCIYILITTTATTAAAAAAATTTTTTTVRCSDVVLVNGRLFMMLMLK